MKKNLLAIITILLLQIPCSAIAQVVVTFPTERAVFQRNKDNAATIYIGGYVTQGFERIEARFVPWVANEGEAAPGGDAWQIIDNTIEAAQFYGSMPVKGGWYRLEVRAIRTGTDPVAVAVQHVGVGEVFVVAGQSNATGGDDNPNGPGAKNDQVNSVNYQNINGGTISPYPSLELPCPEFVHLDAGVKTAPFGNYAWCWGSFGDKIYEKFRVPVMIFNAGWSSTGVGNWQQSIDPNATPTSAFGYTFPAGMPFGHLRIALNYYIAQMGVRAVLWHQGETDNYIEQPGDNTFNRYISNLWDVIGASRSLTGKSDLAWLVARASRFTVAGATRVSANVVNAQNELINNNASYPHVYQGPETDPYFDINYRGDQIHFRGDGVTQSPDGNVYSGLISLAGFWADKVTPEFLTQSEPYSAMAPPAVSAAYSSGGSQITFTGPSIGSGGQYNWLGIDCNQVQNTSQQWTVGPGTFKLKVIDANRNTVFSPQLYVSGSALPVTWKTFTAKTNEAGRVQLQWATATEMNTSHFEVERSDDAMVFTKIKSVNAAGYSKTNVSYQYEDEFLMPGTYYYRLKQVDADGAFDYTRILPVKIDGTETIRAYPNPVTDFITIQSAFPLGDVEIINAAGVRLHAAKTSATKLEISMKSFPNGLYTILMNGKSIKIVK
ncbi:hypothetical protein DYBT9623_01549 [Dyadobacter sp. CECT 9623]|uniref:Secretion system C-terminal sorting domain-containing protein n=1 Tax=Dyadobacter linearis TaxID=2823330 RepID=A0ABM8UN46_9BACT|nr:T9SS type A sorting domain-containing protein [Dyadobacter sp. CECT 9623]CAG5068817.1 hypothetical protein DYBT9623_01549 [Dyadobacter sp. CECT 9623]